MNELRIGIVGTNFVSDWLAEAAAVTEGVSVPAVYSRTAEKGSDFCSRHAIPRLFTDYEEFLSSDIDAVYIASPNCMHCSQTLDAIAHGKHVLCEKPIASNSAEYKIMREAAENSGVVLLEAMRPAFDPALEAVKTNLSRVGKVRRVSFEFCQYSSRYDKFRAGEVLQAFRPEFSNAAVMDIGVYPIHFCIRLFGRPTGEISSHSVLLENGFEGSGEVILPYGEMTAVISYAKTFDSVSPSIISGEDGAILIDKMSAPKRITFVSRGGESHDIPFDCRENNMIFELLEFARLIHGGEVKNAHAEYSALEMEILDGIRHANGIVFPADKA